MPPTQQNVQPPPAEPHASPHCSRRRRDVCLRTALSSERGLAEPGRKRQSPAVSVTPASARRPQDAPTHCGSPPLCCRRYFIRKRTEMQVLFPDWKKQAFASRPGGQCAVCGWCIPSGKTPEGMKTSEVCKPGSVLNGHLSVARRCRRAQAASSERPGRPFTLSPMCSSTALLRIEFTAPPCYQRGECALTALFHPYLVGGSVMRTRPRKARTLFA